jgi:Cytochrome c7 and related cytochrome c
VKRILMILFMFLPAAARADFRAMVSPGPLARPHAALDKQCDKCHVPFQGIPAATCLECHPHTAEQLKTGKGTHAAFFQGGQQKCSSCHHDHKGRDHQLSPPVEPKAFDHLQTGFPLEGRHKTANCQGCHVAGPSGPKWVGIPQTCVGCHADTHHKGALGTKCQTCHEPSSWTHQTRTLADHKVPMTGKHQGLPCATCHKGGSHFVAKASCGDCHAQKHGGTKAPCETCHNTSDWKSATFKHDFCTCILPGKHQTAPCLACHPAFKFTPTPFACASCHKKDLKHDDLGACSQCHSALSWKTKAFDHNKKIAGFPIDGKHTEVGCENCHTRAHVFKGAPKSCEGCHKVPKHGDFGGCAQCHTTVGFDQSSFKHEKTRFALDGAHGGVACETCHARFKKGSFVPGDNACVLCHTDPHAGQFDRPAKVQSPSLAPAAPHAKLAPADDAQPHTFSRKWGCKDCHTGTKWKPSTIGAAEHGKFAYPLRFRHAQIACQKCHRAGLFVGTPSKCASCHMDFHGGALGDTCDKCHSEKSWHDTPGFDHASLSGGFALVNAHAGHACADCHGEDQKKLATVEKPVTCATCHTARHGRQFGNDCASCHKPTRFADVARMTTVQHVERTGFPLERRHALLSCTECHDARRGARVPATCAGCHQDPHRGAMGLECGDCHRPDRWTLVRFDHDRTEFPLRGRHFATNCTACHKNNLWTGTRTECVTCHARDRPANDPNHPKRWDCGTVGCHTPFAWHDYTK